MNHAKSDYLIKLSGIGTALFLLTGVVASIQSSFEDRLRNRISNYVLCWSAPWDESIRSISFQSRYEIITTIDFKLPQGTTKSKANSLWFTCDRSYWKYCACFLAI